MAPGIFRFLAAVGHAAESSSVRMTFRSESRVVLLAMRVMLSAHAGPVIERIPQTRIAPSPHDDHLSLAALASDGCRTGITADRVVISFSERL